MENVIRIISISVNILLIVALIMDIIHCLKLKKDVEQVNNAIDKDMEINKTIIELLNDHTERLDKLEKGE